MKVGFIGLGDQGYPMAERIVAAGWPLAVWARKPAVTEALVAAGAHLASSPADLAQRSDLIGLCVAADRDVIEVVEALRDGLRAGTTVVVHSTVSPPTCHSLAEQLSPLGVDVLDAPVSGGRPRARAGTLSVMVGGDHAVFERARPVFESFGEPRHVGPLGSGEVMKLLNNGLLMAHLLLAGEAVEVAARLGLDPHVAEQQLLAGTGASAAMSSRIRFRELDLRHVRAMLAKDHRLFQDVVSESGAGGIIDGLAYELLQRMADGRWG